MTTDELTNINYLPPGETDPDADLDHARIVAEEDKTREHFRSLFSAYPGSSATGKTQAADSFHKTLKADLKRGQGTGTPFRVGGMVAFMLKPEDAAKIALPGGEDASELHCTLNVLDDDDANAFPIKLAQAIEMAIEGQEPLKATLGGLLLFPPSDSSDGLVPVCLTVDCPGLTRLQLKLSDSIGAWAMVEMANNHGYTPHVCRIYVPQEDAKAYEAMPPIDVVFDIVSLVRKDGFRHDFPLLGDVERAYNPDQPRDAHGRFGSGGESKDPIIKQEHKDEPQQLGLIKATGGFTYTPVAGAFVGIGQQGYGVSPYPEHETIIEGRATTAADLHSYVRQNEDLLKQPNHYAGAWFDPEAGKTYLDISIVAKTEAEAAALSEKFHQEAYFDYKSGNTIYTHSRQDAAIARSFAGGDTNGRTDRGSSGEAASNVGSEPEGQVTRNLDEARVKLERLDQKATQLKQLKPQN